MKTKFTKGQKVKVTRAQEERRDGGLFIVSFSWEPPVGSVGTIEKVDNKDKTLFVKFSEGTTWVKQGRCSPVKDTRKRMSLDDVILPVEQRKQIEAVLIQHKSHKRIFDEWGFGEVFEKGTAMSLLFYGPPGTGKTMAGQAIADSLGKGLQIIRGGDIWNKYVGEDEKNVRRVFDDAAKNGDVLMFDECDSLISRRDGGQRWEVSTVNELLGCLEWFDGVVIFTTNRLPSLDQAVERRLSAKIGFEPPDEILRTKIWKRMVPKKAPIGADVDFGQLSRFPMPGGNIKNVVLGAAREAAFLGQKTIDMQCFLVALEREVKSLKAFRSAEKKAVYTAPSDVEESKLAAQKE